MYLISTVSSVQLVCYCNKCSTENKWRKKVLLKYSSSYLDGLRLDYFLLCFKWSLVFYFSIDNLRNLTIVLFTPTSFIHFILSYVERCQTLSGNEYRLYLNSCFSSCCPHILLLMPLIGKGKGHPQQTVEIARGVRVG